VTPVKKLVVAQVVSGHLSGEVKAAADPHNAIDSHNRQTVIRLEAAETVDLTLESLLTFAREIEEVSAEHAKQRGGGNPNA
jgi:hypothetical protein